MKKMTAVLLSFTCILALLSGCGGVDDTTTQTSPEQTSPGAQTQMTRSNPTGESWTVLVYLCGTDLETLGNYASINIAEMTAAAQSENVNVIFQTGGTKEWAFEEMNPSQLERWKVSQDSFELVDSQPLASMGEADTLGDFLSWGTAAYPADKYMAVLWNHGGGSVSGIAVDELFGGDALDLQELSAGVAAAGVQFEVVGFDACLMATIETAAALSPYARYMVASQELEPGTGWDYTAWLDYLAGEPAADGLNLGKVICDSFYQKCARDGTESLSTLSVTDLSQIPALVQQFDQMAAELKGFTNSPEKLQPLTQAIVRAENYGGNNDNEGYTNMVDLGDLTLCAKGVLSETGDALLESLFAAIPYNVAGAGRQRSNGLSVYVPLGIAEGELDAYAQTAAVSGEYLRFIEGLYDWKAPAGVVIHQPVLPPPQSETPEVQEIPVTEPVQLDDVTLAQALNSNDFSLSYSLGLSEDGYIVLDIDEGAEIVSTVAFDLFYHDEETNALWYLGSDFDVNMSDDGTQYWDNFRNLWTIIGDKLCMMQALSFTDEYILYTVPVTVNGHATNLRMLYHIDAAEYEVIGTWDGIDSTTGMSSREVSKLKDGDVVTFVFSAADLNSGEAYESDMALMTSLDGDITVELI